MSYKQQVADFYNSRTDYDNELTHDRAVHLLNYTKLHPAQSILDVATGTGNIAIAAAKQVKSVIGIDIATELLKIAQRKIAAEQLANIQLIDIDVEAYQAEPEQFDAIYCSFAIVLFPNIPAILQNWYRFLKPNGFIAFSCSSENSYLVDTIIESCAAHGVTLPNIHYLLGTPARIQNLLRSIGFHSTEIHPHQLGKYLTVEQAQSRWSGKFWLHIDNPLPQVDPAILEQIKASYDRAIATLATDQGVWHEELIYYVTAMHH
jgi:arsenite methyltransferase